MRELNTRVAKGNYSIIFETDDRKAFEQVQTLCRILIDGKDGDAIPKEWLLNHMEVGNVEQNNAVYDLVKLWEIENETN